MLTRRSMGLLCQVAPLFDAALEPANLTLLGKEAELPATLQQAASEWNVSFEVDSIVSDEDDNPVQSWKVSEARVVSDAGAIFAKLVEDIRSHGARVITRIPTSLQRVDGIWQASSQGEVMRSKQLMITSEPIFRDHFPALQASIPLGNFFVVQQHFARLDTQSQNIISLDGSYTVLAASRGQRLSLSPLPALVPGDAAARLSDAHHGALSHLVGEPRDVRSTQIVRLAHDLVPVVDEIADQPGLWVAFGFGDQDVSLAPAALQMALARGMGFRFEPVERVLGIRRLERFQLSTLARSGLTLATSRIGHVGKQLHGMLRARSRKSGTGDSSP